MQGRASPVRASRLVGPSPSGPCLASDGLWSVGSGSSTESEPSWPISRPAEVRSFCSRRAGYRQDPHAYGVALDRPGAGDLARGPVPLARRAAVLAVHRGAPALARRRARGRGGDRADACAGAARAALRGRRDARAAGARCTAFGSGSHRISMRTPMPPRYGAGYVAWVEALAERGPIVLAVEDLHWAHASTRELAEDLLELTDRLPLMVVATLRREPASEGWRFRTRVLTDFSHRSTEIALDPLGPGAAREILAALLPGVVDEETAHELVVRAEGNPLYLEELLRGLLEAGGLERTHRTWTMTLRPSLSLPPALESLLVARIDRLAEGTATAGTDRGGAWTRVLGAGPRACRRRRDARRSRGAPACRDRARGASLPRARVRIPARSPPGGDAVDAHARAASRALRCGGDRLRGAPRGIARRRSRAARALPRAEWGHHAGDRLPRPRGRAGGRARCRLARRRAAGALARAARSTPASRARDRDRYFLQAAAMSKL